MAERKPTRRAVARPGAAPAPAAAAGPWGQTDPITWAQDTGRVTAASAIEWRARYAADPAGVGATLATLYPVLAELDGSKKVAASARRPTPPPGSRRAYAANPLVDEVRRVWASAGAVAEAPPSVFNAGDVPLATASGVDPEALLAVPWQVRHRIAEEPGRVEAYRLLEQYADDPDGAELDHRGHAGNRAYEGRVAGWMDRNQTPDEKYSAIWGQDALTKAKEAEHADRDSRRQQALRQLDAIDGE